MSIFEAPILSEADFQTCSWFRICNKYLWLLCSKKIIEKKLLPLMARRWLENIPF